MSHFTSRHFCSTQQFIQDQRGVILELLHSVLDLSAQFKESRQVISLQTFTERLLFCCHLHGQCSEPRLYRTYRCIDVFWQTLVHVRVRFLREPTAAHQTGLCYFFQPAGDRFETLVPCLESTDDEISPIQARVVGCRMMTRDGGVGGGRFRVGGEYRAIAAVFSWWMRQLKRRRCRGCQLYALSVGSSIKHKVAA